MNEMRRDWDVIIVGAGIAGASCGYFLSASRRVLLLERESGPGYHTTGRSAAFFTETYGNATVRALSTGARDFFARPPEGFSDVPLWHPRPVLQGGTENQRREVEAMYAATRDLAAGVSLVDGAEARRRMPLLRAGHIALAVADDAAMELDVAAIHQGYLRGLAHNGGKLLCGAEVRALGREGETWTVETAAGTFEAPVVVDAAGAWGDELARLAGAVPRGLAPKRRTIIVFDHPQGVASDLNLFIDVEEAFYVKPESGGLLASPCDETPSPPCDAQPEEIDVALAADRVMGAMDVEIRRIRRKWAGLRSFVADRGPVAGFDPLRPGFFWLIGQGGFGIMTSPAMGRASAALIEGRGLPDDLTALGLTAADLAPDRPALPPR